MAQSRSQIYLHIVYSTKNRAPFLRDEQLRGRLHGYMVNTCGGLQCPTLRVGGVEDHVHILCRFGRDITVVNLLRDMKRQSSVWVKSVEPGLTDFHWQRGYGAFSISPAHVPALTQYIADQEDHHRHESFQDEFRRLCKKYGMELDERYAWD